MISDLPQRPRYGRRPPLVLVNGLAEQSESWFCNLENWQRHFDVHTPNLLAYDGNALHRRIEQGLPISIDYLVEQLRTYVDEFLQTSPIHLVANSLGGKIAVEFAVRFPDLVDRLVLLCPSGLAKEEQLPIVEGVRRNDIGALVSSVFFDSRYVDPGLVEYFRRQFTNRRWRTGLLRTIRGTMETRVRDRLRLVQKPTLLVVGRDDRIVNADETIEAAAFLPHSQLVVLTHCGHAPQMEKAEVINELVVDFLTAEDSVPAGQADALTSI